MSNSHELQLAIAKLLSVDRGTGELTDEGVAECLALIDSDQIPQGALHDILGGGLKLARMIEDDNLVTHHVTIKDRKFHPEQLKAVAPCRILIRCEGSPKSDGHCLEVYRDYPEELVAESCTLRGGNQFACNLLDAGQYRITDQVYGFMTATIDVAVPQPPTSAAAAAAETVGASTKPQPTTAAVAAKASDAGGQPLDAGSLQSDQVQLQVESSSSSWVAPKGSATAITTSYRPSEEGTLQLLHSSAAGTAGEAEHVLGTAAASFEEQAAAAEARQPQHFACGLGELVFDPDPSVLQQPVVPPAASSDLHQAGSHSRMVTPSPGWDSNQRSRWSRQLSGDAAGDAASTTSEESGVVVQSQRPSESSAFYGRGGAFAGGSSSGAAGAGMEDGSEAVCRTGSPCSRGVTSSDGEGADFHHEYEPLPSDDGEGGSGMAGSPSSRSSPGPAGWAHGPGGTATPSSPTPSPTFTAGSTSPRQTRRGLRGHRSSTPRSGNGWAGSGRRHGGRLSVGSGGHQALTSGEDTPEEGSPRVAWGGQVGCVPMEVDAQPPSSSWHEACTQTRPNILGGRSTLASSTSSSSPAHAEGRRPAGLLQRMHLQHQHQQGTQTEDGSLPLRRAGALAPGTHVISSKQAAPAPGQLSYQSKQSVVTEELLQQEQPHRHRPRAAWQLQVQQQQAVAPGDVEVELSSDEHLGLGSRGLGRASRPVFTSSSCCLHMQDLAEEGDGRNPEDRIRLPTRLAPLHHSAYGQQGEQAAATQWQGSSLVKGTSSRGSAGRDAAAPAQQRRQVSINAASIATCAGEGSRHGSSASSSGSPTRAALAARGLAMSSGAAAAAADGSAAPAASSREGKAAAKISPRSRMKQQAALQATLERQASEEDLPGGIPEVKCPRCKKAYYSTFNLWRCKHIHATSQGGSRHKVHHEEVKAFLRGLNPAEQAALLDVSSRPEARLLLHSARRHQQDPEVLRGRGRMECMETLCRRTDLLLPLVQGWEAARQEQIQWPTVEEIMRLLEDASEGAFMDPNITKCSVEVMEEGHGADASSTGAIGAGPNSKWRYNACKLTHPIELAAGMAFLIEHSIADARYKAREEESARIAQELLQIEAAAAAASSKSTKKRKGSAAPLPAASASTADEETAAAAAAAKEEGQGATSREEPAGSTAGQPAHDPTSKTGSHRKHAAAGAAPAASVPEVPQGATKEQPSGKHVRQGSASSNASDAKDGTSRGGRQAGKDHQQQQQPGRHPVAPAVAAMQQGKLSAASSSRASSRRSSFASTASDPDTPTAAAAAAAMGAGDAAGKGVRVASRLRSSSSVAAAADTVDSSHKQVHGSHGPSHTAGGAGAARGAGDKAPGKDVKNVPRVAPQQQHQHSSQQQQQQHKVSVQDQGQPQQRQQARQKPAAQALPAQPAAAAGSQAGSNKQRPHPSSGAAVANHGAGSKQADGRGMQPAKHQQQQPRQAAGWGPAGPAAASSTKPMKPPAVAPASTSKAATVTGVKAGTASSGPPGLGRQPPQQQEAKQQGHAPAAVATKLPAAASTWSHAAQGTVSGGTAGSTPTAAAAAAAQGPEQDPQQAGAAHSQARAEPDQAAAEPAAEPATGDQQHEQQQLSADVQPPQEQQSYPMGPSAGGGGGQAMHPAALHHQQMMMQQYYMDMYMHHCYMQQQQQQLMQQQAAGTAAAGHQQQEQGEHRQSQQQAAATAASRAEQQRPPPITCGSPALGGSDTSCSTRGTPVDTQSRALSPQQQLQQQQAYQAGGNQYQGHPDISRYPMAAAHPQWAPPGAWSLPPGATPAPAGGEQLRGSSAGGATGQELSQQGSTAANPGQDQHPGAPGADAAWQAHQQHLAWLWQQHHMQQMYHQHMQAQAAAQQQHQQQAAAAAAAGAPAADATAGQGESGQPQVVALRFGDVPDILFSDGDSETPGSRPAGTPPAAAGSVQPALSYQQQEHQQYPAAGAAPQQQYTPAATSCVLGAPAPGAGSSQGVSRPQNQPLQGLAAHVSPSRLLLLLQQALGPQGLQQAQRIAAAAHAQVAAGAGPQGGATPAPSHNAAAAAKELDMRWAAAEVAAAAAAPCVVGEQHQQQIVAVGGSHGGSSSKGGGGVAAAAAGRAATHPQPTSQPSHGRPGATQPPAATHQQAPASSQLPVAGGAGGVASSVSTGVAQQDGTSRVTTSTTAPPGGQWHVPVSSGRMLPAAADPGKGAARVPAAAGASAGQQRPATAAWSTAAARDKAAQGGAGGAAGGPGAARVAAAGRPSSAPGSPKQWPALAAAGQGQVK